MKHQFNMKSFSSRALAKPKMSFKQKIKTVLYLAVVYSPLIYFIRINRINFAKNMLTFFADLHRFNFAFGCGVRLLNRWSNFNNDKARSSWWGLMRQIINILQDQQLGFMVINPEIETKLTHLSLNYKNQDFESHDKAFCLIAISLWMFERGKINMAVLTAAEAAKADLSWGYGDFMVGWYKLFLGGNDAVKHFNIAVSKDWSFLHRINKDSICQKFPSVLKEVNRELLVKNSS